MKKSILILILLFATLFTKAQTTKPDTNKYYFPFTHDQLDYLTKQSMKIDSILVNSTLPAKDAFQAMEFINSIQSAFLQNFKIQAAEIDKKKVKPTTKP
jgi:hypothetical protein